MVASTRAANKAAGRCEPVPRWGAERIIADRKGGMLLHEIAAKYSISLSTVKRILENHRATGAARVPRQGTGRRDDPRWVFAGSKGALNLIDLERAAESEEADADEMYVELYDRWQSQGGADCAERTMRDALRDRLNYSTKQLTTYAAERDAKACDRAFEKMITDYRVEQFLLLDETNDDQRTANRRRGRSKRGTRAFTKKSYFHRGSRESALGAFNIDGFVDAYITYGGFNTERFLQGLRSIVKKHMNPCAATHRARRPTQAKPQYPSAITQPRPYSQPPFCRTRQLRRVPRPRIACRPRCE